MMSAARKFSWMCFRLNDIGMVATRGWETSHASAIWWMDASCLAAMFASVRLDCSFPWSRGE